MKRSLIGSGGGKGSLETWCSDVTTEEARALAQILERQASGTATRTFLG